MRGTSFAACCRIGLDISVCSESFHNLLHFLLLDFWICLLDVFDCGKIAMIRSYRRGVGRFGNKPRGERRW
jgi:hypothetical protein